jgi:hypothetical protein
MKYVSMTVILISALTLTLVSSVMFNGIQQVRAEEEESEDDKGQVNTERQQINKCENNSENEVSDVECNNVIVYGVVCMPGAVCTLENFDVPFELVIPL